MSEEDKLLELANWLDAESRLRELLAERLLQAVPESSPSGLQRSLTSESFAQYAYTVKTLGQKIRERREELDLSLREFAKKLKCSPPFISDVEHGRRFPSEPMLEEMARLLKLDLAELKQHDPRAPLDEIKRMTEQDPGYAFAFRTLVEKKLTPEELLDLVNRGKPPPKGGQRK